MIKMGRIEVIRELYEKENWSIQRLSHQFGHCRKTIRRYLKTDYDGIYERSSDYSHPIRDFAYPIIKQWVFEDETAPRKQKRTAQKMYDDLVQDYQFTGSYRSITEYVKELRDKKREVFIPRENKAGEILEFDFGYASVDFKNERIQIALHCYQLVYSNDIFVVASLRETQSELLETHKDAFLHFGGVPQKIRYDNLRQVVKKCVWGGGRETQKNFDNFREQFGFESEFCEVGKGWQKGDVEGCVGYVRRNFFSPVPKVESFEKLNEHLSSWCQVLRNKRRVPVHNRSVEEMYQEERLSLNALPSPLPMVGQWKQRKANHYSLIQTSNNSYSVPSGYAFELLDVLEGAKEITVFSKGKEIARHSRCFDINQQIFNPLHYLNVFKKKPYALINSRPIHQLPEAFYRFFKKHSEKEDQSVSTCIAVLKLLESHSVEVVALVLEEAIACHTYHIDGIKVLLNVQSEKKEAPSVLSFKKNSSLNVSIPTVPLQRYNQLLS